MNEQTDPERKLDLSWLISTGRWATSWWATALVCLFTAGLIFFVTFMFQGWIEARLIDASLAKAGERVITKIDLVFDTAVTTLVEVDALSTKACSADDLANLRTILVKSKFIMDIARDVDNRRACSVLLGVMGLPYPIKERGISLGPNKTVYWGWKLLSSPLTLGLVVRGQNSALVVDLDAFHVRSINLVRYAVVLRDGPNTLQIGLDRGNIPRFLAETDAPEVHHTMRVCSNKYPLCASLAPSSRTDQIVRDQSFVAVSVLGLVLGSLGSVLGIYMHRRWSSLPAQIRRALHAKQFVVRYQPIVRLDDPRRMVSAEALLRWPGGPCGPEMFITTAEASGDAASLTEFVLRTALSDFHMVFLTHPNFRVTINVSIQEFLDGSLMLTLDRYWPKDLGHHHIGFELTERTTSQAEEEIIRSIAEVRRLGHPIYVDDFGTGYSSLAQLQKLPIDYIKVDRSLLPSSSMADVDSIIPEVLAIARRLGVDVVFEGVETEAQTKNLDCFIGCAFAQGWFFGRPETAQMLVERLIQDRLSN